MKWMLGLACAVAAGILIFGIARAANQGLPADSFALAYWLIRMLPFQYAVDFVALAAGLLATGQLPSTSWRMLPLYCLPVLLASLLAYFAGYGVSDVPVFYVPSHSRVAPTPLDDYTMHTREAVLFLLCGWLLIFALNLASVWGVLKLNEAVSYRRVPLAAAVIAMIAAPYTMVPRELAWVRALPLLIALLGVGAYYGGRTLREMMHVR